MVFQITDEHVLIRILINLPDQDLNIVKLTCKTFYKIIKTHDFWREKLLLTSYYDKEILKEPSFLNNPQRLYIDLISVYPNNKHVAIEQVIVKGQPYLLKFLFDQFGNNYIKSFVRKSKQVYSSYGVPYKVDDDSVEILKVIRKSENTPDDNYTRILCWLIQKGIQLTLNEFDLLIQLEILEVLKIWLDSFLGENPAFLSQVLIKNIVVRNQLNVLIWLYENYKIYPKAEAMYKAVQLNRFEIIVYFAGEGIFPPQRAINKLVVWKNLDMLKFYKRYNIVPNQQHKSN